MERDYQGNFKVSIRDKICVGSIITLISVITLSTIAVIFNSGMLLRVVRI